MAEESSAGVSARKYAAMRGVDESTVRKALREGKIKRNAVGRIDPEAADQAWRASTGADRIAPGIVAATKHHPAQLAKASLDKACELAFEEGLRAGRAALAEPFWLNMMLAHTQIHARLSLAQLYAVAVVLRWELRGAAKMPTSAKLEADVSDLNWEPLSQWTGEAVDLVKFEGERKATDARSEAEMKRRAQKGERKPL